MSDAMAHENWLRLTDYSAKYRVSVSTLRRRLKTGQLAYRFDDGRYLIKDEAPTFANELPLFDAGDVPRPAKPGDDDLGPEHFAQHDEFSAGDDIPAGAPTFPSEDQRAHDPIISSASRLLGELKRAYTNILQEKEEQIIQLKEEVSDLKTLVRVLEEDNDRMRRAFELRPVTQFSS